MMATYYLENRDRALKYQNEYYQKNKETIAKRQKEYFKKYYDEHKKQLIEKATKYRKLKFGSEIPKRKPRVDRKHITICDPFKNINYYRMWQIKNEDHYKKYQKEYYEKNKLNKEAKLSASFLTSSYNFWFNILGIILLLKKKITILLYV